MKIWTFLAVAIVSEVVATLALKSSDGFSKLWPSALVVIGYGLAFFFLSLTLKEGMTIGVVYAIWSGLGVALVSVVGWLLFQQKLDLAAIIGISLIVCGVVVMNVFSKAVPH